MNKLHVTPVIHRHNWPGMPKLACFSVFVFWLALLLAWDAEAGLREDKVEELMEMWDEAIAIAEEGEALFDAGDTESAGKLLLIGQEKMADIKALEAEIHAMEREYKVGWRYAEPDTACLIEDVRYVHETATQFRSNGYIITGVSDCESGIVSMRFYTRGDKFLLADFGFISGYIFTIYTENIPQSIKFPHDIYTRYHIKASIF